MVGHVHHQYMVHVRGAAGRRRRRPHRRRFFRRASVRSAAFLLVFTLPRARLESFMTIHTLIGTYPLTSRRMPLVIVFQYADRATRTHLKNV